MTSPNITPEPVEGLDEILDGYVAIMHRPTLKAKLQANTLRAVIEVLESLGHDKQMWGDWQDVVDNRITDLKTQLERLEGVK